MITRRMFLGGAGAMPLARVECGRRGKLPCPQGETLPIVMVELVEKRSWGGEVVCAPVGRRLVCLDLNEEDDVGEIECLGVTWCLGNDAEGYWTIARVFELMEPEVENHEGRWPVWYELDAGAFGEMVRLAAGV